MEDLVTHRDRFTEREDEVLSGLLGFDLRVSFAPLGRFAPIFEVSLGFLLKVTQDLRQIFALFFRLDLAALKGIEGSESPDSFVKASVYFHSSLRVSSPELSFGSTFERRSLVLLISSSSSMFTAVKELTAPL